LTDHFFFKHFSSKWLIGRDEQIKKNDYVYSKLKDHLPKSGRILDLGCGLGSNLLAFKDAGYDVYGVDPSKHRSEIGMKIMPNIITGTAEEYLSKSNIKFDAIYLFDVLQFVKDPYKLLSMSINSLVDGGKLFFKIGIYHHRSNFCQFSHFGVLRSYINMYSIKDKFNEWGVEPVYYQKEPFEIILSKSNNNLSWRENIGNKIKKLDMYDIEVFAKKTLNYFRLKFFRKTKLKYLNRATHLELIKPIEKILPIKFRHHTNNLPIIFK
jgi:SAM-dependent methyltransferase